MGRLYQYSMDVEMNCTETKKRMLVGSSERVMKAKTSFVLSLAPIILFLLSKNSLTMFLMVKKSRSNSRITLILIRAKIRILFDMGRSTPRSKTLVPR